MKSKVDELDIDKLVHVHVDWMKLSDLEKNDVIKKDLYNAKYKILKIAYLMLLT